MGKAAELLDLDWVTKETLTGDWTKTYKIDQNAPLEFRLIDNRVIMNHLQKTLKSDSSISAEYDKNLEFIQTLRSIKLWLKLDECVLPMTLHDVYTTFTKNLKDDSFDDQLFNCNEVSFLGPLGPFKNVSLIQCLNDRMIGKFLFESSLKSKIPSRNLRVRTNEDILVTHGEREELQSRVQIKQITNSGILFSSLDGMTIDQFSRSEELKFHINTKSISQFTKNNFRMPLNLEKNFFYCEDGINYFKVQESKIKRTLSYKSDETNEFFLFVRYCDMKESEVPREFMNFTQNLEKYFQYFLKSA